MAKVEKFEDLEIWQKAMDLAVKSYHLVKNGNFELEYSIKDQIIRSSFSITNNIAEGFEYNSNNQFIRFLKIAKGSAGELRNQLHFLNRINYLDDNTFNAYKEDTIEVSKQISSFIKYLDNYRKNNG